MSLYRFGLRKIRFLSSLATTIEALLLFRGLETTMAELGSRIDELELDLFQSSAGLLGEEGLAQGEDAALGADDATLEHQELLVDDTVVRETAHRGDGLLGKIGFGASVGLVLGDRFTDAVDLLVHLGTVMITVLTSAWHLEFDTRRMPGTDTGNLTDTTMGFTGQFGNAPTGGDTFVAFTLGDAHDIDGFVHAEDGVDWDLLFEKLGAEVDLVRDGTAVDLDLDDVGSFLALHLGLGDLRVADGTDDLAVLLHLFELSSHFAVLLILLLVTRESLALGFVPVLVEAALALFGEMLGPDGGEGTKTSRGLDVADNTDDDHRRGLDDGNGLGDLLLVVTGAWLVQITSDMGHTSLETHETGQMAWLGFVIDREGLDLALVMLGTLARQESQGSVAGCFKLTVRHLFVEGRLTFQSYLKEKLI